MTTYVVASKANTPYLAEVSYLYLIHCLVPNSWRFHWEKYPRQQSFICNQRSLRMVWIRWFSLPLLRLRKKNLPTGLHLGGDSDRRWPRIRRPYSWKIQQNPYYHKRKPKEQSKAERWRKRREDAKEERRRHTWCEDHQPLGKNEKERRFSTDWGHLLLPGRRRGDPFLLQED